MVCFVKLCVFACFHFYHSVTLWFAVIIRGEKICGLSVFPHLVLKRGGGVLLPGLKTLI